MLQPRRLSAAVLVVAAVTAFSAPATAAPADCLGTPSDTGLTVSIEGLRNGNGLVTVALYPDDSRQIGRAHV